VRGIECVAPNCAHLHAEDDEQLVQAAMRHAEEVHSDMPFPESAAREFVQNAAYHDTQHAGDAGGSISG
jgi:predicted small metal-binding protein